MSDLSRGIAPLAHPNPVSWPESAGRVGIPIYRPLVCMAIALCPFQDTILQYTPLKLTAASFSFVPLACLLVLSGVQNWLRRPLVVGRNILFLIVYCCAVCAANTVWIENGEADVHLRLLLPYTIITILVLFTVLGVNYRPSRWLRGAVYFAFFFTVLGIVSGQTLGANAISFLQVTPSLSGRPHGFSTEPGTLSVQIVAIGMLAAHYLSRSWQKWSVGAMTCALLVFSSSKGGIIVLLLCTIVLALARARVSLAGKIIVGAILLPFIYFGGLVISSMFGNLIEANETSTIATRVSMTVYAVITVAHHPFGVGFNGFLPSIPRYLPTAMRFVQALFPVPLAFGEVREYLYPPQADADCKTFFFNFLVFFGIPFAVVFFRFTGGLLSRLFKYGHYWLFVGVLFSASALMTYYSTLYAWTLPILFGISVYEVRRSESAARQAGLNPGGTVKNVPPDTIMRFSDAG
jgi:hypothetical protein